VDGVSEEARDRVRPDQLEERSVLDGREEVDLLIEGQLGKPPGAREAPPGLGRELLQPLGVLLLPILVERDEDPIDEVDDPRLSRSGSLVGRDDLRGHRLDLDPLLGREECELEAIGRFGREDVLLGRENRGIVGQDPRAAQAGG
jgi:hypothetical protein